MKRAAKVLFAVGLLFVGFLVGLFSPRGELAGDEKPRPAEIDSARPDSSPSITPRWFHGGANTMRSGPSNDLLARAGVTQDDIDLARTLQQRRERGEFILRNESPVFRKLRMHDFREIASREAAKNAPSYTQLFSEIGIDAETGDQLQKHLEKIQRASLESEVAINQILHARQQYDQRMKSLLTDGDYTLYREFEEAKPAEHEMEMIRAFMWQEKNTALPLDQEVLMFRLVKEENLVDDGWWHGPYGPLPQVNVGAENVQAWASKEVQRFESGWSQIAEQLAGFGLSESDRANLADYYAQRIDDMRRVLDSVRNRRTGVVSRELNSQKQP